MGAGVSRVHSDSPLSPPIDQWYCPRCSCGNPMSVYPTCLMCDQQDPNFTLHFSNVPLEPSWHCASCTFENKGDNLRCNACGRTKFAPNHQESNATNRKALSSMRPMSVSIRDRRHKDESNAEKIFRDIISFCHKNKIHFVDDQFPPSFRSLGTHISDSVTQWLRISDISPSSHADDYLPWTICCSSPQPSDIQQGELGDCWLMAALALMTERPRMLRHILLTENINREGVYLVRICHNGLWKTMILDDCFPCTRYNTLAYSKATRRQLYVPLIEKACAKLFGSYGNLRGGSTAEGLQLLTGAPCDRIELNPSNEILDPNVVWAKLLSACESKLLIGASTGRSDVNAQEYHLAGIHGDHAFSVLSATALTNGSARFLLVRDPHGSTQYSDNSITMAIRTQLHLIHETRHPSGIFWIAWPNFLHFFDSLTISTYISDHFDIREQAKFTQSSTESVAAYYFYVAQTSLINVSLLYHRRDRKLHSYHTQSFVLCNVEQESGTVGTNEIILQSRRGAFTYWTGSLRPGTYVLIPFSTSFWQDHVSENKETTRDFTLVIHSSIQLNGTLVNEPPTVLADCLIAAAIKYCDKPEKDRYSTFYATTSKHFGSKLIIVENISTTHYLHVNLNITEARNIRHSRRSLNTHDFIPPRHRQLICIVEWTNQLGESAHINSIYTQSLTEGWHNSVPFINIDQHDLHTARPTRFIF